MKMKHTLYVLILLMAGCATDEQMPLPTPRQYSPHELSFSLSQDSNTDLLLELRNEASSAITNLFPQTRFEGKFYFVQAGAVPAEAYTEEYFNLVIHALWSTPSHTIEPYKALQYRVPLSELVFPFSGFQPEKGNKILVYAFMDRFEILSNAIELKDYKTIEGRTSCSTVPSKAAQSAPSLVR
jgi:hypothetical protein